MKIDDIEDEELRNWVEQNFRRVKVRDPKGELAQLFARRAALPDAPKWMHQSQDHWTWALVGGAALAVGAVVWYSRRKPEVKESPVNHYLQGIDAVGAAA